MSPLSLLLTCIELISEISDMDYISEKEIRATVCGLYFIMLLLEEIQDKFGLNILPLFDNDTL